MWSFSLKASFSISSICRLGLSDHFLIKKFDEIRIQRSIGIFKNGFLDLFLQIFVSVHYLIPIFSISVFSVNFKVILWIALSLLLLILPDLIKCLARFQLGAFKFRRCNKVRDQKVFLKIAWSCWLLEILITLFAAYFEFFNRVLGNVTGNYYWDIFTRVLRIDFLEIIEWLLMEGEQILLRG